MTFSVLIFKLLIPGIALGCVYGLNGVGASLLYKGSHTINNAQGAIVGISALIAYRLQSALGLGLLASTFVVAIIAFFIGIFIQIFIVSEIEKVSPKNVVLATIALGLIISCLGKIFIGSYVYKSAVIEIGGSRYFHIDRFGIDIQWAVLVAIVLSFASMFAIHVFLNKTKFGMSMRAAAMDSTAAEACGVNTTWTRAVTWGLMSTLGAVGGCLLGPLYGLSINIGIQMGNKGNTGAVLGGYGNMYGAIIGGIIVGILETICGYFWSAYQTGFTYALFIIFILLLPRGIMNEKAIEE